MQTMCIKGYLALIIVNNNNNKTKFIIEFGELCDRLNSKLNL